jgi:ubiquinone/menaquinone biosynthesis C-methylase UbiE
MTSRKYFNSVAKDWDAMRQRFFADEVRETAFRIAEIKSGKTAADLGAGTGYMTEGLLREGLTVIAVDQSREMLAQMKKKFVTSSDVDFRPGDSENLPIGDESVDFVFANMYLHHVESPLKAIKEMSRILRPGGSVVITDLDEHDCEFLRTEQHDRWLGFKRHDVVAWLTQAGLTNTSIIAVGENCCSTSETTENVADITIFAASGTK